MKGIEIFFDSKKNYSNFASLIMKKYIPLYFSIFLLFGLSSCKTEFEKIRVSGDVESIYKEAEKYYANKEYQKASTLYELVLGGMRGRVEAEKIYFNYAYCHYHMRKYILGAYYFNDFSKKFLNSPYREEADFMNAYCNYKLSPTYRLDQTYTQKAIDAMQVFVNTYPESERVTECNQLIDIMRKKLEEKSYAQGELYFNLKQYEACIQSFENLLKDFPDTTNDEQVRYMLIRASYNFAQNSIVTRQAERYNRTMKFYDLFRKKYPESQFERELTTIYNTSTKKLKSLQNDGYKI